MTRTVGLEKRTFSNLFKRIFFHHQIRDNVLFSLEEQTFIEALAVQLIMLPTKFQYQYGGYDITPRVFCVPGQ